MLYFLKAQCVFLFQITRILASTINKTLWSLILILFVCFGQVFDCLELMHVSVLVIRISKCICILLALATHSLCEILICWLLTWELSVSRCSTDLNLKSKLVTFFHSLQWFCSNVAFFWTGENHSPASIEAFFKRKSLMVYFLLCLVFVGFCCCSLFLLCFAFWTIQTACEFCLARCRTQNMIHKPQGILFLVLFSPFLLTIAYCIAHSVHRSCITVLGVVDSLMDIDWEAVGNERELTALRGCYHGIQNDWQPSWKAA